MASAEQTADDFDFAEQFGEPNEELAILNAEALQLEKRSLKMLQEFWKIRYNVEGLEV